MKRALFIVIAGLFVAGCAGTDDAALRVADLQDDAVRIATYNVHHWTGDDGEVDVARVAAVIANLDAEIVVLQEVDNKRSSDGRNHQDALAEMLDYRWAEIDHPKGRSRAAEGNAILVAPHVEILGATGYDISEEGRDPRAFVDTRLRVRGETFHVVGTHLGLKRWERRRQTAAIAEHLDSLSEPVFVMGDLNEWNPLASTFGPFRDRLDEVSTARTFPAPGPLLRLDRIWTSDSVHADAAVVRTDLSRQASDHLPVRASVRF